jgi:hypothetical protein
MQEETLDPRDLTKKEEKSNGQVRASIAGASRGAPV